MLLKPFYLGCLILSATSSAFAQIKDAEQPIQQAFASLRGHPGLQITLDGMQKIGDVETPFKTVAYWFQDIEDGRPMSKVEVQSFVNGIQTFRIVGDGVTLYSYDKTRNEYSSSRYGSFRNAQPGGYVNTLLSSLKSLLKGQSEYAGRLLNETYGGDVSRYTTWVPGTAVENTGEVVRYVLGNPVHRNLEFWYAFVAPNTLLNHIDYFDSVNMGVQTREISWTITLQSFDVALDDASFSFVPPAGARAIAGVRVVTGGP